MAQSKKVSLKSNIERLSPLSHRDMISSDRGLEMKELPFRPKYILRSDAKIAEAAFKSTKLGELAKVPCTSVSHAKGHMDCLWLSPDEWMLVFDDEKAAGNLAKLEKALLKKHHQIADVSDYYTFIELSGIDAREVLMNLTTIDMHAREFPVGSIKGTLFGHANAYVWMVEQTSKTEIFRLFVRASMADYLWCLIAHSSVRYGLPDQSPISGERLTI